MRSQSLSATMGLGYAQIPLTFLNAGTLQIGNSAAIYVRGWREIGNGTAIKICSQKTIIGVSLNGYDTGCFSVHVTTIYRVHRL